MKKLLNCLKLMRPKQWIKNLFVFGAILFSGTFSNTSYIYYTLITFVAFCFISSTVYVINDIVDIENDKVHPKKCKRPLAAGDITIKEGIFLGIILAITALTLSFLLDFKVGLVILTYLIMNLLYTFKMKQEVILDIFSIAIGFILRLLAGSFAIGIIASKWIILCTLFLSLYLGFGKRRNEIITLEDDAANHRAILSLYSISFLDQALNIVLTCTIIFYAMYTAVGAENRYMIGTVIFVVYGVLRYNYLIFNKNLGGSPTEIVLKDKPLIINIVCWVISCITILSIPY